MYGHIWFGHMICLPGYVLNRCVQFGFVHPVHAGRPVIADVDTIVRWSQLRQRADPGQFLHQAKTKLTQQGRLLVVIPNIVLYRYRIAYLFGKFPSISLSHKNFQVPKEVERLFKNAGFSIERKL